MRRIERLVVDDQAVFKQKNCPATYARNSRDALEILKKVDEIEELWLDHDLGGRDTIMVVVDWLVERALAGNKLPILKVFVHSMNVSGADQVILGLNRYYDVVRVAVSTYFTRAS